MRYILFFAVLSSFLFFSCNEPGTVTTTTTKTDSARAAITIDAFTDIPAEIDGCSCFFSRDSAEFGRKEYIYASDNQTQSFLKINGKMQKFIHQSSMEDSITMRLDAATDEYELTIRMREVMKSGDEGSMVKGVINLKGKHVGMIIAVPFYGVCGC